MWDERKIEDLLERIFRGEVDPFKLPTDLFQEIEKRLINGFEAGFGGLSKDLVDESSTVRNIASEMEDNVRIFSAAKTFQQVRDMTEALKDGAGNNRSFSEFENVAKDTFDKYNRRWLEVEQRTANNQAASGRNWARIEENKDLYPMLVYRTQGDDRVRDEHEDLEGTTKPVEDPFWDSYMPPNGFNCRCPKPKQSRNAQPTSAGSAPRPHPLFDMNPGKDRQVFKEDVGDGLEHPYFRVDERYEVLKNEGFGLL